jgi:hypothetical protein
MITLDQEEYDVYSLYFFPTFNYHDDILDVCKISSVMSWLWALVDLWIDPWVTDVK